MKSSNTKMKSSATFVWLLLFLVASMPVMAQKADFVAKNADELSAYLQGASGKSSPLTRMSSEGRERFIKGLVFNDAGLASYDYSPLVQELNAAQAFKVLQAVGAERTLHLIKEWKLDGKADRDAISASQSLSRAMPEDHVGYRCEGPHTCGEAMRNICMSGC